MHQQQLCNLKIHVNGQSTFILNQEIISAYSGKLKRMINEEQEEKKNKKKKKKKKTQIRNPSIEINEFPGGSYGFELISKFCYNNGRIPITPSNISVLHSSAIFLEMTEDFSPCNLLHQTETFLEGMFYWSWSDILISLKNCEGFFTSAESSGLVSKLISSLLTKISQNSDLCLNPIPSPSPSSSSSSPETPPVTRFRLFSSSSTKTTPESSSSITATPSSPSKSWWFDDLSILSPKIIEKVIETMGYYGTDNNNLVVTKFLLHYLKTAFQTKSGGNGYSGLAETAVYGAVLMGKTAFSCRGLFWVQRVVSGFGMKRECRDGLERLIGEMLEKATLDDLLVCGGTNHNTSSGEAYDVDLVLRLIRVFVNGSDGGGVTVQRMKKVGRLVDKYMGEISPDHNLKVSKFLAVAESLPACARDCFDGVYRAIDIYLESHPTLSFEKRSKLCKCLNYEKLTLEACKDLAKNPRIPPNVAVQALISQKSKVPPKKVTKVVAPETPIPSDTSLTNLYTSSDTDKNSECSEDKEELKLNLQRMQCRVMELEKVCSEMKSQMSKMVKDKVMGTPVHNRTLYKLC